MMLRVCIFQFVVPLRRKMMNYELKCSTIIQLLTKIDTTRIIKCFFFGQSKYFERNASRTSSICLPLIA